jgi:hypothetical protein
MPKRRARREAEAKERYQQLAQQQSVPPIGDVEYNGDVKQRIVELLASGTPIDDVTVNGAVVSQGIASSIGVAPGTIYRWQREDDELASGMAKAREEFTNRICDKKLALADFALKDPTMANAIRVAGDLLEDVLKVRNKGAQANNSFIAALERIADCDQIAA